MVEFAFERKADIISPAHERKFLNDFFARRCGGRPILVAYLLTGVGLNSVFAYFGVVAVIGAAAAAGFTVETKNRSLELASAVKVH